MPIVDTSLYRTRTEILADMLGQLVSAVPDAHTGEDGVLTIIFTIEAGQLENLYLAHQLLLEDMFIQTASYEALLLHGAQYGLQPDVGSQSTGTLRFEGAGGTYIPTNSEVGYDPGAGLDVIYFLTTTDGTIPNPGSPSALTAAINATAGNLTGTYEYLVTFVTAGGETLSSPISNAITPAAQQANLTAIPIGGVGTLSRNIYRQKNGSGNWRLIHTVADNTTTTYTDNVTDAAHDAGTLLPTEDTAHRVIVSGQAEEPGTAGNVAVGAISELTNAPTDLIGVSNTTAFVGGTEPEDTEDFRARLLAFVQNPFTGSQADLVTWATAVTGVESATVFPNTPGPGQVTVRISGPGGTVPDATTIANAQAALAAQDLANITVIVTTFTAVPTNVSVTVTLDPAYVLSDVIQSVTDAIANYINSLSVGGTVYISGLVAAITGLPGILDVTVTTPATNQTTAADSKRTPGTITVTSA
jgi:uncharacterized phage protein gp47/JayE